MKYAVWLVLSVSAPRNFLVGGSAAMPDALADHVAHLPGVEVADDRAAAAEGLAAVGRRPLLGHFDDDVGVNVVRGGLTRHAGRTAPISILDTVPLTPSIIICRGGWPLAAARTRPRAAKIASGVPGLSSTWLYKRTAASFHARKTSSRSDLRRQFGGFAPVITARAFGTTSGHCQTSVSTDRFDTSAGRCRARGTADEGDPIAVHVLGVEVAVGGDEGPQVFAECQVDGRAIVERADAHVQDLPGDRGRFLGQPFREVVRDIALGQHAGAAGSQPEQLPRPAVIDTSEGREDGGDEKGTALVRLRRVL